MMSDVLLTSTKYAQLYQVVVPYRMNGDDIKEFSGSVINTDDRPVLESRCKEYSISGNVESRLRKCLDSCRINTVWSILLSPISPRWIGDNLDFIDLETGLDAHGKNRLRVFMLTTAKNSFSWNPVFTKGSSQFLIVALPLLDQPLTDDLRRAYNWYEQKWRDRRR